MRTNSNASAARAQLHSDRQSAGHDANNFDLMRLVAAGLVLVSHSFPLATGNNASEPLMRLSGGQSTLGYLSVGIFFVMSGYLITASFLNSRSVASYFGKRLLRIYPALVVMTLLTSFLLGPIVTSLSIGDYLRSPGTYKYLLNMFAVVPAPFGLPAVFDDNPFRLAVNGSLWTLKFEIMCYVFVSILGIVKMLRGSVVIPIWIASFFLARLVEAHVMPLTGIWFYVQHGAEFFEFFGAGMILYLFRDRMGTARLPLAAAVTFVGIGLFTDFFLEAFAVFGSYAVIRLAAARPVWISSLVKSWGDFSYGVYIYAFPVQQTVSHFVPDLRWYQNAILSLPVVLLLSVLSWHLIERRALALKRAF